ncbi:MAG: hypothetical protein UY76_C0065G0007 [Candidatus Uhrbacteria bacterium GW2011_GWA2_52_8d]|uniref:Uncharacterized protein n=1 Tax=Candidatus Uhrbacteria bacterium GW2011_GWA2_52_8d TaxID=1618979 RepID=A0A0G2AF70_9BACT|nr:MAG: hypothetical protein UY76_C0065G0007 [Candidatus Uhrbacteria bacterium GW2011_GWA2_52_8d]
MICEMDQATEMEDDLLFLVKDLLTREPTTAEMKQMKEGVQVLVDRARFLSQFSVLATHATKTKTVDAVESSAQIYKSQDRNFEGDGVYFGIFGSFKEWGDEYFTVRIPLAYAHPNTRITSNGYGQAMINVLCDAVILRSEDAPVRMRGLLQWRRPEDYDWYKVWEDETGEETVYSIFPRWKLDLIKELIPNKSVEIAKDKSGQSCLVMDTQELPIVWASVCRALCIPRLIPLSELEDFGWKRGEPIPDDSFLSRRAIQLSTINAALDLTDPKFRYGTQERRPAHEDDDVPLNTLPPSDEQDRSSTLNW